MRKSTYIFLATISLANASLPLPAESNDPHKVPNTIPRPNFTAPHQYSKMWEPQAPVKSTDQVLIEIWEDRIAIDPHKYRMTDTDKTLTPWIFK